MVKAKVYETMVVSYLAAAPSRDIVVAGHQETTRAWWSRRDRFELFVSQAVVEEASRGNAVAAARRMAFLEGIPVLGLNAAIDPIANQLLRASAVPAKARIDAVHVAVAASNRMEYLVTWNLAHIAAPLEPVKKLRFRSVRLEGPGNPAWQILRCSRCCGWQ